MHGTAASGRQEQQGWKDAGMSGIKVQVLLPWSHCEVL